ncbi:hypothetical protein [Liberibacter crescens]|uniref:hypothetical protein n=1 Tax=Liberibacter crescens TaxID=1273132 RepID=UPI000762F8CC|nr:hypothetical protein [Liberibacter crescens]AMC12850.1 hypothetical protein RL73_04010 [Liberibacter crescens]
MLLLPQSYKNEDSPQLPYQNNDPNVTIVHIPPPTTAELWSQEWYDFIENIEHSWASFYDFSDSIKSIYSQDLTDHPSTFLWSL